MSKFVAVKVSVTPNAVSYVNVTGSDQSLPQDYNDGPHVKVDAITTDAYFALCNLELGYVYVTIFPDSQFQGDVTFSSYKYNSKIDYTLEASASAVPVGLEKGALAIYYTTASTTETKPKRMVVNADTSFTGTSDISSIYLAGPFRQCNSPQYIKPSTPTFCKNLGDDADYVDQYFVVYSSEKFTGSITIEDGSCVVDSGATLLFSLLLLFLIVILN